MTSVSRSAPCLVLDDVVQVFPGASRIPWLLSLGRLSRTDTTALHGVSLRVGAGEIVGMLGPNGAGKSTLMRAAAGLLAPTSGRVRVEGLDPSGIGGDARGKIGMVIRDDRSFSHRLTARQNLAFFAQLQGLSSEDLEENVARVLDSVALTSAADRPYRTFSSGMAQRLSIARALLRTPRLLLLDEATGGLDPGKKAVFYELVRALVDGEGLAVLYATHDLVEAEMFCDRLIVLDEGRMVADGTWSEVKDTAESVFLAHARGH